MKLSKYGMREWLGSGIIAAIVLVVAFIIIMTISRVSGTILAVMDILVWFCIAAFFRVPNRKIPQEPALILSPADGVVRDIEVIKHDELEFSQGQDMIRIGIFLSVFNVHVNRAPADMVVTYKKYKEGKYLDARHANASKENESMLIAGTADIEGTKFPVAVRQISGAIARRIVCPVEPECQLQKGQIYGMIKFGSRTELYLPYSDRIAIKAKIGDKVYSGISIMAELADPSGK